MIRAMKSNISITIDSKILEEVERNFPDKKRSQVIEEALSFWNSEQKKNKLKNDALKLKKFMAESNDIESELLEDGLSEV